MDKVYVGRVVNTHGIKGELRIKSNFPFKSKVFKVNNKLIIDDIEYNINSYRVHKDFDMVTLGDYTNINDVLFLLKKDVYFDKNNLLLDDDEVLDSELMTFKVIDNNGNIGEVVEVFYASSTNKILRVKFLKEVLIPFNSPMIKEINKRDKCIVVEIIEGM